MSFHLQADVNVTNAVLARFRFTSYNSIVQARVELAQQIRLSMQHPQAYTIAIGQLPPDGVPNDQLAAYVHPWNIACALLNVCVNGLRFGGENLAPQEDLQVYVGEWAPLQGASFPTAIVPLYVEPTPQPAAITPAAPEPVASAPQQPVAAAAPQPQPEPTPEPSDDAVAPASGRLPPSDIKLERKGQSGRPQKSPLEKKIEERNKVADPPFWWTHLTVSAPKIFTVQPSGAVDDSSTGAGPVQSYMVLVALLRSVLGRVNGEVTVAELRAFLQDIDAQVARTEHSAAANQLRKLLVPAK